MKTQTCKDCKKEFPLTSANFHRNPGTASGFSRQCKQCRAAYRRVHNRKPETLALNAMRMRKFYPEAMATPEGRAKILANSRNWKRRNPEKRRAHAIAENALRKGLLVWAPCEICKTAVFVEMHHDDYTKPLSVRWLCRKHHRATHRSGLAGRPE